MSGFLSRVLALCCLILMASGTLAQPSPPPPGLGSGLEEAPAPSRIAPSKPDVAGPAYPPPSEPEVVQPIPWGHPGSCSAGRCRPRIRPRDCCDDCCADACNEIFRLWPEELPLQVYGWFDAGFVRNASSPTSGFNGPFNSIDRDEILFNQAYLVIEKKLDTSEDDWDWGGRFDLLYGFDYLLAQSFGFEQNPNGSPRWNGNQYYGLALPQIYGEFGCEHGSVKLGHFYSIVGYEDVPAVNNFFYTHSYAYMFGQPFTHWGGLATWGLGERWTFQAGLTNGWNALDRVTDRLGYIGSAKFSGPCDRWSLMAAVTTGDENTLSGRGFHNRTVYSLLLDVNLTPQLEWVLLHEFGAQQQGAVSGDSALWYGLAQYVYYRLSPALALGSRLEWFRDDDGTRVGLNRPANPNKPPLAGNYYAATLGLNWTPHPNLRLRPEVRWDWFDGGARPFDDGNRRNQFLAGLDVLLQF